MSAALNDTHRADLLSWVESANDPHTDFPIQNLPFGVYRGPDGADRPRVGIAIGARVLDIAGCLRAGLLDEPARSAAMACGNASLNALMALGPAHWSLLRSAVSSLLRADAEPERRRAAAALLLPLTEVELLLPAAIGDYTDFYASVYHATNVGSMFRPDNPLLPNYKYVPIGYHGRSSSIVVSGTPVRRPHGQTHDGQTERPSFGPSRQLDYEAEVGAFVGPGNGLGQPISIDRAEEHIFGLCLVNDWSARDIQRWEYQPLGPFLAKSFATTISPWIVTLEALEPFRGPAFERPPGDPDPLPYLQSARDRERGGIDLTLEVDLTSAEMRRRGLDAVRLSRASFGDMYWTIGQLLTHHASNGCNLRPGDLLASGTVSGATKDARGCLLELTWRGMEAVELPTGELRRFLEDGDEVIMRAACAREGFARIGFGDCRGTVCRGTVTDTAR